MKLKRLTALLLAAAMAFSTAVTALPAYAEGEGGAASGQSAPDADSTPGGPADGNTPGDPASEPGGPAKDGDPNSGPAGDPNSDPAGDPTGDPGTQQGEECTCTALCVGENVNDACTVCSSNAQNCAFQELEVNLAFDDSATYLQVGSETELKINAMVASKTVESVTIKIALSEEESGLISFQGSGNVSYDATNRILSVTLTPDENGEAGINSKITIKPGSDVDFATLEITRDDIQIVTNPEGALTDDQISVGVPSKPLTFVKKLPNGNDYGSGVAFETTVASLTVTYVDSEGNPAAIQQDPPEYKLYYQVEGWMTDARPVEDSLPFGLETDDLLTVTTTAGESTWTGAVEDASKLPSQVLVKTDDGYQAVPVTWTLVPSYKELYNGARLVQITEANKDNYPAGLTPGNWYYIAAPEPYPDDTVTVDAYLDSLTHTLYWADNLGADGKRPTANAAAAASLYELQFAFDGSSDYQTLTAETLKTLGLEEMPAPAVADNGASWTLTWKNSLPQTLTYTDSTGTSQEEQTRTVSWRVTPKNELADYTLVEVTDENKGHYTSVTQTGPYYVLNSTMTFTVRLNRGKDESIGAGRQEAFFEQFYLDAMYGENHQRGQLDYLEELGLITLVPEEGAAENPDVIKITVTGLWRYNLDSSRITYTIQEGTVDNATGSVTADGDGRLDGVGGVPQGDWLAISYDNSAVPNYGDAVDKVYDGGTINLTLTGETSYTATKNWLDEATQGRPDAVVELWRYRAGQSYTTAAPVRDSKGGVLTFPLSEKSGNDNTCTITFGTGDDPLPKYDAEGYPYLYVAREYLTGEYAPNYEQVLGAVDPETGAVTDTLPEGVTRESGNTYLYQGGTLSNRLRGTVPVAVTKDWKAASFQSEFEGVMVRLRLQSRPVNTEAWTNTETTYDMAGFYAENLTQTYTGNFPQYDAQGRELEYRWVEEAVYQGGSVNEEGEYVGGQEVASTENADGTRTFTLTQSGRTVTYRSTVEETPADEAAGEPACTEITNAIANTIDYAIQKEFKNPEYEEGLASGQYEESYTFTLFQSVSGSVPKRYLSFTVSKDPAGKVDVEWHVKEEDRADTVEAKQDDEWHATVTGLPEYDADGQLYEYLLMEQDGTPLDMTFQIDADGDYTATVTNSPGGPHIILVRKEWIDESDSQHREPVTVAVYDKKTNEPVKYNGKEVTVTLGSRSEGVANGWYAFVAIGEKKADEVYVLETKVGSNPVDAPLGDDGKQTCPTFVREGETDPTAIEYSTDNHKYAVTYSYEANFGEEEGGDAGYQGCACYTITNRRLGNIDLTVTKTWRDGDGEARTKLAEALKDAGLALVVQLSIQSEPSLGQEYTITNKGYGNDAAGDTVTIAPGMEVPIYGVYDEEAQTYTTPADSIQPLELKVESGSIDTQELHFYGLPKYDGNGAAVRYTVDEVFVNAQTGTVVEDLSTYSAVQAAWQEYQKTVTENDYVVGGEKRERDQQSFDITNRLGGTKDVTWYALWQDEYAYESGNRPDVFLNIYRTVHVKGDDGDIVEKTEAAILNYRWENVEDVDAATFWQCIVDNLPKYDEYGYEIKYYAEMQALVTAEDFYYLPTRYAAGQDSTGEAVFGNEDDGVTDASKLPAGGEKADYILESKTVDEEEVQPGHAWLLRAGNTFVNTIQGAVTYQGEKVWKDLPYEYPDGDLPTVTFALDRQVGDDATTKDTGVATMTITHEDWAALAASGVHRYTFTFTHTGENEPVKTGEGVDLAGKTPLPRFDKLGRLYTYTLREANVKFDVEGGVDSGIAQTVTHVFKQNIAGATVTNTYAPDTGVLTAKKYLTVPVDAAAYPAITLRLTRTYTQNDGKTSDPENVPLQNSIGVWSAADVTNAVNKAKEQAAEGETTVTVDHTFTFEDLPLYAPNGSPYVYTITEDKGQLGGYDTWAAKGDVPDGDLDAFATETNDTERVPDLTPRKDPEDPDTTVDASFLNKPEANPTKVTLTGTKVWEDLSDAYGFRPEELTLTLQRHAPAQTGQDNDIPWEEVPSFSVGGQTCTNGSFTIQADPDAEGSAANTWSYTVTGLDRYAPNGRAWVYQVTETVPNKYTADSTTVMQAGVDPETNTVTMKPLTNSILTEVEFQKAWVDSDGKPITQDVLGGDIELEVTFQVQVSTTNEGGATGGGQWKTIAACFANDETMQGYEDEKTIRAPLGSDEWGKPHTFENLPLYIKNDIDVEYKATYRVVETSVKIYQGDSKKPLEEITYQASKQEGDTFTYTVDEGSPIQPYYGDKGSQSIMDTVHKNQLQTTSLTAKKVWAGDNPTVYATRPASEITRYDWQTTLVVERSADDGATWQEIPVEARETVYGTNDADTSDTVTFSGLPTFGFNDKGEVVTYKYRVREVNTDEAQTLLENKGTFHSGYTVTYTAADDTNPHTVTNTLQTTTITAEKKWNDDEDNGGTRPDSITLELQYLKAGGNAAAETDWCSFAPQAVVTLDGTQDTNTGARLYYEDGAWTAIWEEVPVTMPGSAVDEAGKTLYRVKEVVTGAYIIENEQESNSDGTAFTITNTPSVTPSVQKTWLGVTQAEVTVQLQRAVEGGEPQDVPGSEATLNAGNSWQHTFDPQPKYDENGSLYTYTVVETKVGGQDAQDAAKEGDFGISYGRSPSDDYALYVYNYKLGALHITKDWADVDDVENRPETLALTVERTTDQNPSGTTKWEEVKDLTWTWTKNGQNDAQWTITFDDLPLYDVATGAAYTYRVREETVPEGYVCEEIECETPLVFHFKNTRYVEIDIPVQKYWVDNNDHFGWRKPVTVELYANDEATGKTLTLGPSIAETIANFFTGGDAGWGGVFEKLPKYDEEGRIIQYTIVETTGLAHYGDPDYNTVDDTLTVTNTANGELTVRKTVLGNGTDPGAAFHFTVTLDKALDGTYGDMTFAGGVAEFTLQNGQSKTAGDLPAGTAYTVTEAEAGKGAYITTSTGASGRIEPGATVEAAFTNDLRRISVPVTKRWEDDNDRLGIRPASITVKLRADGADTGKTLTLNSENGWSGSFAGLPEYENGQKIAYTVEEVQVRGYATQITGDAGGYLIVNRLLPAEGGAPQDPAPTAAPAQIIPQTGDDLPVGLLAGLAMATAGGLAVLLALRKRRGRK